MYGDTPEDAWFYREADRVSKQGDFLLRSAQHDADREARLEQEAEKEAIQAQRELDTNAYRGQQLGLRQEQISLEDARALEKNVIDIYKDYRKEWIADLDPKIDQEARREQIEKFKIIHPARTGAGGNSGYITKAARMEQEQLIDQVADFYTKHTAPHWSVPDVEHLMGSGGLGDTNLLREIDKNFWIYSLFQKFDALGEDFNQQAVKSLQDPNIQKAIRETKAERDALVRPDSVVAGESSAGLQSELDAYMNLAPNDPARKNFAKRALNTDPEVYYNDIYRQLLHGRKVGGAGGGPPQAYSGPVSDLVRIGSNHGQDVAEPRGAVGGTFTGSSGKTTLIPSADATRSEKEEIYHADTPFRNMADVAGAPSYNPGGGEGEAPSNEHP